MSVETTFRFDPASSESKSLVFTNWKILKIFEFYTPPNRKNKSFSRQRHFYNITRVGQHGHTCNLKMP